MTTRTVTLHLPEALYERAKETAEAASQSLDEVLARSIALSLPELEEELPPETRATLARLALLSDEELKAIAKEDLDDAKQTQLESLAELRESRELNQEELETLARLMNEANQLMLRKAESYRLLARRGYPVFSAPD